jgi:hypothetical protein
MFSRVRGNNRGRNGNDRGDTCPALTFSCLPEFEEEGNKDAYKETKHSGD